jgi:hypothetical protein
MSEARSLVCSIDKHYVCDGNAPNGPAGVGHPCSCSCHPAAPRQSETHFVFPDGTVGPGNWNPETQQIEPAR